LGLVPTRRLDPHHVLSLHAFFDHPHIFQTFSRTHADKSAFQARRALFTWGIAAFIAVGFVVAALNLGAQLIVFAAIFGTWHIIRQHAGLIKAYKNINRDTLPIDNWLDFSMFYVGMFACLFNDYSDIHGPIEIYRDLRTNFPSLPPHLGEYGWNLFLILLMLWGARKRGAWPRQKHQLAQGAADDAALSTHYFIFFATATPFLSPRRSETGVPRRSVPGLDRRTSSASGFPTSSAWPLKWFAFAMLYGIIVGHDRGSTD
jgi:hypothetical protein